MEWSQPAKWVCSPPGSCESQRLQSPNGTPAQAHFTADGNPQRRKAASAAVAGRNIPVSRTKGAATASSAAQRQRPVSQKKAKPATHVTSGPSTTIRSMDEREEGSTTKA